MSAKERLDPALIRPGRCDVHVHVQNASKDQARRMFSRFFALEATVEHVDASGCHRMCYLLVLLL